MPVSTCDIDQPGAAKGAWNTWISVSQPFEFRTLWISRIVILTFAIAMFIATWASWPDLVVDCGREMYVPQAMLHGRQLYRDVWYPYGPLAPTMIALLFRMFGVHLNTLYGAGLVIFTTSALVLHSISLRFLPPVVALIGAVVFLAEGFQANLFNFITPYSDAATFMCLLCLLTLLFLLRYLEGRGIPNLCGAGLFAALAVLSKQEAVLPCGCGIAAAVIFQAWRSQKPLPVLRLALLSLLPGLFVSSAIFIWLFADLKLDFLIHGNWMSTPSSYFMRTYGDLWMQKGGLRVFPREIAALMLRILVAVLFWSVVAWLSWRKHWLILAFIVIWLLFPPHISVALSPRAYRIVGDAVRLLYDLAFPQGMFLMAIGCLVITCVQAIRLRRPAPVGLIVTIILALMLGLRSMVEIHPFHYAIFSSPLLLVVFLFVLWSIFRFFEPNAAYASNSVSVFVYFAVYLLLFARVILFSYPRENLPLMRTPMGEVRATAQNEILMNQFLPVVAEAKAKGQKVLLLPELTGLYFMADILAPSRYELLLPGVLEPGKYTEMLFRELENSQPDLIIVSNRRTSEYGVDYFGLDYDQDVLKWIEEHYRNTGEIGHFERSPQAPLSALVFKPK